MKTAEEYWNDQKVSFWPEADIVEIRETCISLMEGFADQFKPKWIPIEEASLEDRKAYYIYSKEYGQHNDCIYNGGLRFFTLAVLKIGIRDVTHVMNCIPNP